MGESFTLNGQFGRTGHPTIALHSTPRRRLLCTADASDAARVSASVKPMRSSAVLPAFAFILAGLLRFQAADTNAVSEPRLGVSLADLPSLQDLDYRVAPYVEAAGKLQAKGQQAAFEQLLILARSPIAEAEKRAEAGGGVEAFKGWTNLLQSSKSSVFEERQKIAVLCRMLFTRRPGSDFKAAGLGGPAFLGNDQIFYSTSDPIFKKWSLEPIELVDGVPFAVVTGYRYEGWFDPSGAELYVRYCMTNCDWSGYRFTAKTEEQMQPALHKLLSSAKWERPLAQWEAEYLAKQLK